MLLRSLHFIFSTSLCSVAPFFSSLHPSTPVTVSILYLFPFPSNYIIFLLYFSFSLPPSFICLPLITFLLFTFLFPFLSCLPLCFLSQPSVLHFPCFLVLFSFFPHSFSTSPLLPVAFSFTTSLPFPPFLSSPSSFLLLFSLVFMFSAPGSQVSMQRSSSSSSSSSLNLTHFSLPPSLHLSPSLTQLLL